MRFKQKMIQFLQHLKVEWQFLINWNPFNLFSALAALAGHHQQGRPQTTQQTHEMTVPNELIGCIIGKGGSKIAEIR